MVGGASMIPLIILIIGTSNLLNVEALLSVPTNSSTNDIDGTASDGLNEFALGDDKADQDEEVLLASTTFLEDSTDDHIDEPQASSATVVLGAASIIPENVTSKWYRNTDHSTTYDFLYQQGIKHYMDNEWHQCTGYLELAIKDHHWYTETLTECRRDCKGEAESATPLMTPRDNTQEFFETTVRNALCLVKCRRANFGNRKNHVASVSVDRDFEMMKPYDYLQYCLYKVGRFQDAASAAVTVLARQPDHSVMANNLKQYIEDFSADQDLLENLELKEYAKMYVRGDRAHVAEDFEKSVELMESVVGLYWRALEDCRLMCEEPFDQGWFPDFVSSVANHFTFTFRCKRRCPAKLSNLYGEEIPNFLASIFNYLQYGYQKLNNIPAACGAAESYLELVPTDAAMLRNKQFYLSEYQKMDRHFVARPEVVTHAARERYEEELLHFIDTEFVFLEDDKELELQAPDQRGPSKSSDSVAMPVTVRQARRDISMQAKAVRKQEEREAAKNSKKKKPVVILKEGQLNGTKRYVADGFASSVKCQILSMLTQVAAQDGDGYLRSNNPHTSAEDFHGLTLSRTGLMVHAHFIYSDVLQLILNMTEKAREHIVEYFDLHQPLYFSYTHLVCRTAKPEYYDNRSPEDMSHTVHVDNCIFQGAELCLPRPPAYTFRDYSAIIYFNDDFEGGEFVFSDDMTGQRVQSVVKPKCGRMVAFSSGPENPHGVRPVLRGSRCALALWFTHDKKHEEKERILAETLLQKIKDGEISSK